MGGATAFFFLLLPLWVQDATAAELVLTRSDFPRDFVFGAGTSAYQVSNPFFLRNQVSNLFCSCRQFRLVYCLVHQVTTLMQCSFLAYWILMFLLHAV
jgi:hypothetical protein